MNSSKMILAALTLSAVALASCEQPERGVAVAGLCPDFKTAAVAGDPAGPVDNCVKRWAYSLAGGRDSADVVAEAAVAACGAPLSAWNQTAVVNPTDGAEAASIITGQPTTPMTEHYNFAQSHAQLYVVQARAGRCAAPAVKDGVPVGV